jgi:hypothetical protein
VKSKRTGQEICITYVSLMMLMDGQFWREKGRVRVDHRLNKEIVSTLN